SPSPPPAETSYPPARNAPTRPSRRTPPSRNNAHATHPSRDFARRAGDKRTTWPYLRAHRIQKRLEIPSRRLSHSHDTTSHAPTAPEPKAACRENAPRALATLESLPCAPDQTTRRASPMGNPSSQ